MRAGPALVMRVNAALRAKIMLGGFGVELIHFQHIRALQDGDAVQRDGADNGPFSAADRAITAAGIHNPVGEVKLQHNRPAMARQAVLGLDGRGPDTGDLGGGQHGMGLQRIYASRLALWLEHGQAQHRLAGFACGLCVRPWLAVFACSLGLRSAPAQS